jgi:hypothetical protein
VGILQFIFDLIFGQSNKKKKGRKLSKKDKKAMLRATNRRLHRIFLMRDKSLHEREKPLRVEKLIERSIRQGKKRAKMKWQKKVQVISHNARIKEIEARKDSLRSRVREKREKASSLWLDGTGR